MYYLDSSALAKLYVEEDGSRRLAKWLGIPRTGGSPSATVYVSRLVFPEPISAIVRRRNRGLLSSSGAARLWNAVASDFLSTRGKYLAIDPSEAIIGHAALLVAAHGLRGYDGVQLASALRIQMELGQDATITFVSADDHLNQAAAAERLPIANPTL